MQLDTVPSPAPSPLHFQGSAVGGIFLLDTVGLFHFLGFAKSKTTTPANVINTRGLPMVPRVLCRPWSQAWAQNAVRLDQGAFTVS